MFDIDILHKMIKDSAKVSVYEKNGKNQVKLTEPQHPNSSVTIYGLPANVIVIKVDAFKSPDTVFEGSRGECKRADFVVVAETDHKEIILYIEMKARKGQPEEIKKQLEGAQCFVAYCREIGRVFWEQRDFLNSCVCRFVSIGHTSISKRKTRFTKNFDLHDRPDKMLKIDWPHHIQFNRLVGSKKPRPLKKG